VTKNEQDSVKQKPRYVKQALKVQALQETFVKLDVFDMWQQ
jgi:hypothetical protein